MLNFLSFLSLCVCIWAIIWSHLAFRRWEERENAKVKALQQIASRIGPKQQDTRSEPLPEWAATK